MFAEVVPLTIVREWPTPSDIVHMHPVHIKQVVRMSWGLEPVALKKMFPACVAVDTPSPLSKAQTTHNPTDLGSVDCAKSSNPIAQ